MPDHLPLLVFPQARTIQPPPGNSFVPDKPHFPKHSRQVERLTQQFNELQQDFSKYQASLSNVIAGFEPETVLIIEIAGNVNDFKRAVDATEGLEWLGERDLEDVEPNDEFYEIPKIGINFFKNKIEGITAKEESAEIHEILLNLQIINKEGRIIVEEIPELDLPAHLIHFNNDIIRTINEAKNKRLSGRLFLSFMNEQGKNELLTLWQRWKNQQELPFGKKKWRDVFIQTRNIRHWGIQETLRETEMIDRWRDLIDDPINPDQDVSCQIELFYRQNQVKRKQNEVNILRLLSECDGQPISAFIDIPEIAFHAVKAKLPAGNIKRLINKFDNSEEVDINLFLYQGIMFFRPTGQTITSSGNGVGIEGEFPVGAPELPPIAAILDGVPNLMHTALRNRLLFEDPENLSAEYQPGERRHGTTMASLVVHGELTENSVPLNRKVYYLPIMQTNKHAKDFDKYEEYFPEDVFFEDRIERAVRRIFEGEGNVPAQAPGIKVINLSICDPERPFIHTPSPCARLLDWLAWKYRVLFCVSAGNFEGNIEVGIPLNEFSTFSDEQKVTYILKCIEQQLSERRLLSPAESINSITVGAFHSDESGIQKQHQCVDLLPNSYLFSPISRFGHGFRRSIKPEILFPGGRKLYITSINGDHCYQLPVNSFGPPGQKVASDSSTQGEISKCIYTHGTSNSTALATRNAARIYEVLDQLQKEYYEQIPDNLIAVLIKALLVHGAQHVAHTTEILTKALKTPINSRRIKEVISRYMGYGAVNIERVLGCTEQRGTVIGCGEIRENQIHEYRFPLPFGLSGGNEWRRMVITLAWFSPINPFHRNLREAKLELQPQKKWDQTDLKLFRKDSDNDQVLRGTVQHEILEGDKQISAFEEDGQILFRVTCKADATDNLEYTIPYGLAVTLEVAENVKIPIYQQIREKIKPQVAITP